MKKKIDVYYIEFLNKDKNFQCDVKEFRGDNAEEDAKKWGKKNIERFHGDMLRWKTEVIEEKKSRRRKM